MEVIASVAIGLNPYIGAFVLAALAALSDKVPQSPILAATPFPVLIVLAALYGFAAPFDFVFGKIVRFAPLVRRSSQFVAPATAALAATAVADSHLPTAVIAIGAAVLAWLVAVTLTSVAARASRSTMWVGLGHIPVLMAAATAAACILPLGLVKP
ncbi:MAG TPA: hypothetical protein VGW38_07880, partial [Chloroflexota bacterium]|nr:hypothetical protein [Chloroflexota bacterium]